MHQRLAKGLARISRHLTGEARDRPAMTSFRLLAVLAGGSSTPPLVQRHASVPEAVFLEPTTTAPLADTPWAWLKKMPPGRSPRPWNDCRAAAVGANADNITMADEIINRS